MMNPELTFYIVRHGETVMNSLNLVQGWSDSPLTESGIEAARNVGNGMKNIPFRSAYCSTLSRTKQTAEVILEAKGQPDLMITQVEGLKEAGFGYFESKITFNMWESAAQLLNYADAGMMYKDILCRKLSYRKIINAIKKLDSTNTAESYEELEKRTQEALHRIAHAESEKGGGNILVIAHGMSIMAMLMSLGGDKIFSGHIENAGVCKVTWRKGIFTVVSMNDLSYAEKGRLESKSLRA